MYEVEEAAKFITKSVDPEAKIIFGAVIDEEMDEEVKITVVATGFDEAMRKPQAASHPEPIPAKEMEINKPMYSPRSIDDEEEKPSDDQDELEIPAFIRKKIK